MQVEFEDLDHGPDPDVVARPLPRWLPVAILAGVALVGAVVVSHGGGRPVAAPVASTSAGPSATPSAPATPDQYPITFTPLQATVLTAYTLPGVVEVYSADAWQSDPTDTDSSQRRFTVGSGTDSPTVTLAVVGPADASAITDVIPRRVAELGSAGDSVAGTVFTALPDGAIAGDVTWNDQGRHVVERTMLHGGRTIRVTVSGPLAATNAVDALFAALSLNGIGFPS